MQRGQLFIISAPSGAGKTSLVKAVLQADPHLTVSISHTTRAPRPGEQQDREYHFVSVEQFLTLINEDAFLEHARVFDNYYGTAQQSVEHELNNGRDVILEIDWQGAQQVKHLQPHCCWIFILPPSEQALAERLRGRGQDSEAVIQKRLQAARDEMSHFVQADYLVVNDNFETAKSELLAIFQAQRLTVARQSKRHAAMLTGLISG
jgi:guanylate kinase